MAHSPKKKAAVVADLILGMTQREAAEKHGVGKGTVSEWAVELENGHNRAETGQAVVVLQGLESRKAQFAQELLELMSAAVQMAKTWAEICQDEEWVKSKPLGANDLGKSVFEFVDRIVARSHPQRDESPAPPN